MATVANRVTTAKSTQHHPENIADLLKQLGDIPPERVPLTAPLGRATERDVIAALEAADKRLYELVDGVLVEKAMSTRESQLSALIIYFVTRFLERHDLGTVLGADGAMRFMRGLVRLPDVSFVAWEKLPGRELPDTPIASLVPDLAVEVLSPGNTKKEMERKRQEYFRAGVRLVWLVQPKTQTAEIYTSPTDVRPVGTEESLDGGDVLPGFKLPLKKLFARAKGRRGKGRRK